jgi:hypothetical protein
MHDEPRPDLGPEAPGEDPSRADIQLFRRALRNDWPIPPDVKKRILQGLINLCDPDHWEGELSGARTRIQAARTIATFASLNLGQANLDFQREKLAGAARSEKSLADAVAEAERLAEAREAEREREEQPADG